jgi:hypothetical protein
MTFLKSLGEWCGGLLVADDYDGILHVEPPVAGIARSQLEKVDRAAMVGRRLVVFMGRAGVRFGVP